jgi:4-aminobutyrate aminotransferase-like enzyme/Ser/Thr protein kinase RdoA (MazF antagonist)
MTEPQNASPWQMKAVESLASDLYGLTVRAHRLPSEYDQVFHLVALDEAAFIMKVMHPCRDAAFIDLQCRTLQHLARTAPGCNLPRVINTRKGEAFTSVRGDDGEERLVWLLSYLPGKVLFDARPHSPALFESIGELLGTVDRSLGDFEHPAARRDLKWDLSRALWIRDHLHVIENPERRALVARVIELYESDVVPQLPRLRRSVIYGDGNDYNILVEWAPGDANRSVGLIDFGDMHEGVTVAEPAVAAAYAVLGKEDPLATAAALVAGYNRVMPLEEHELQALFPLIAMRLAVSVVNSAVRKESRPADPYVTISEAPAWDALERLHAIHPRFARYVFRHACGLEPVPGAGRLTDWLETHRDDISPIIDVASAEAPPHVLDLGIGSVLLGANPEHSHGRQLAETIRCELRRVGSRVGIGRHDEARLTAAAYQSIGKDAPPAELATIHIGVDIYADAGTPVRAPLPATVHGVTHRSGSDDSDARVILRHQSGDGATFYTLYRHLLAGSTAGLTEGQRLEPGHLIGKVGSAEPTRPVEGNLAYLHFQLATDLLDEKQGLPAMVPASLREIWRALSPSPNGFLGIAADRFPLEWSLAETLEQRGDLLGGSLSISYRKPLKIVRGWRQYLYDDTGRPYLDVFNNVPLVGHGHPRIVDAVCGQLRLLNTNTRYLHDNILRYAQRLTQLLPRSLRVCYFVNSGSEANELAIRMARTHTSAKDVVVLENAYHGNTATVTDISPYKFNGPGGGGQKPWVHVAPIPDDYRGPYRRGEPGLAKRYAAQVTKILGDMQSRGRRLAAYIAESVPSVGGQVFFPAGYLAEVYRLVRAAGGVCIADEVQVGFGRLGSHFWGFETQNVVPDIVVLAKPIGNCFPLAAVVTTPQIAASFHNGMEFFSTYGGNPVSCAAGLAVLDVLQDEGLQANALRVGDYFMEALHDLQLRHPLIGDVRGLGLFLGIDLVTDRETRTPATRQADHIVNRLRQRGVLAGTDGPYHNVIKLRPPLIVSTEDVDLFVETLNKTLREDLPPW